MSNTDYLTDFSPKCMCFGGAFKSVAVVVTCYLLLPLSAISLIEGIGPALSAATSSGSVDFGELLLGFTVYFRNLMIYSIPLIFISAFVGLYEPGSYARIPFKFLYSLYLAAVLLMFSQGGYMNVTIDGSSISPDIVEISLGLEIKGVIYILAIISALKGFLAFAEFTDNRKKYLENTAKRFNKSDEAKDAENRKKEKREAKRREKKERKEAEKEDETPKDGTE